MAIGTNGELKAAIENWLARTDQTARVPEFISLAEAEINRRLNIREMESRATASTVAGTGYIVLPTSGANFLLLRRLLITSQDPDSVIEFRTPQQIMTEYGTDTTAKPRVYSIIGTELQLRPVPDAVYTLEAILMNRLSAISDSVTPVLFTNNPDLYLYGALAHAIPFINEPDETQRFAQFRGLFEKALEEQRQTDRRARWGGAPLVVRSDVWNP